MKRGWMMVLSKAKSKKPIFLVRPSPIKEEGVAEYLQRLAKANGLARVSMICHLLQVKFNEIVVSGHAKIQAVIHGDADPQSLRHPISRSQFMDLLPARVCISCLQESDLLSAAWSKPLAISCQRHNKLLQDHCPRCFRLILRIESQYHCICGQVFAELEPQPAPIWESTFQVLFIPRKKSTHDLPPSTNGDQRELQAANLLRRIINASGYASALADASPSKNRIFTSDHEFLGSAANSDFNFSNLWETAPWLAEQFKPYQRRLERLREDSASNIASIIGCNYEVALRLLNNPRWRIYIRRIGTATPRTQSVATNLRSLIDGTASIREISDAIGIPNYWKGHFGRLTDENIKVSPLNFSLWRIPKRQFENFKLQLHKCRSVAQPVMNFPDGFLRITEIPSTATRLQNWIQHQLEEGELKLVYEDCSPKLRLIDFSVPVAAFSKMQCHGHTQNLIKRLTRFPKKADEPSPQEILCHSS